MTLRSVLLRALGAAFVLVAPLLLGGASVRACLRRDIEVLAQEDPAGRAAAQARIAAFGPPGVRALVESLAGPAPVPAMKLLRSRGGQQAVPLLIEALADEDEDQRHFAGMALAYIGADAVPALVETLGTSRVPQVRASAAWVLAFTGEAGRAALPALETALSDHDKDVRHVARFAIQQLSAGNEAFWDAIERSRAQGPGPVR